MGTAAGAVVAGTASPISSGSCNLYLNQYINAMQSQRETLKRRSK